MSELLYETTLSAIDTVRIDREAGIIFDVKIIGCASKNGRHYPNETLRQAIPLYEQAKVNVDHSDPRESRSYHDRFGMIRNVRLHENEGLFADFWFNPKHPLAEQFLWDAEHAPDNVGFSHHVEAVVQHQNHAVLIEKIVSVRSVDLVADPAATQGLFESTTPPDTTVPKPVTLEQVQCLIEDRLQQFQHEQKAAYRDIKPQSREQMVAESTFDSKAFAAHMKNIR